MAARWFPSSERSTFAAIYTSGNQLASVVALLISSYLCGTTFLGGWPSIFYLFATIGCIWIVFWIFFASNTPESNPFISKEEILYIRQQIPGQSDGKAVSKKLSTNSVPWMKMATSLPLYANIVAQFSFNFSVSLLQTYLPTYMKQVLKVNIGKNGAYAMLPFLTQLISKNILGVLSDNLKKRGILNNSQAVKIFQVVANTGVAICFLTLAFFSDCERTGLSVGVLALCGIFVSSGIPGFFTSLLSIAPSFTGTLFSLSMLSGTIANAIAPGLVGIINKHGTNEEWMIIWLITGIVNIISATFFFFFGSGDVQEWAKINKNQVVDEKKDSNKINDVEKGKSLSKLERRISEVSNQDFS
ncbi:hypothetical protein FO519_001733 [Halicephalobus sp. NKZ332]|nr:hypothetical protein FO519_001733 [Halicephalobus sp. NKZ332]